MYDTVFIHVTRVLYLTLNNFTKMAAQHVDYNFLGKSGLKVSNIALGTMTFGKDDKSQVGCSFQSYYS